LAIEEDAGSAAMRPEERFGAELRRVREERSVSLRGLAKKLSRSHSNLVEYERGHRLAPRDVVEAYEAELGLAPQTLTSLRERAWLEIYGEDQSRRRTYVLRSGPEVCHQLPPDRSEFTGRETELSRLRTAATRTQDRRTAPLIIAAIAGMGGVGKTALAVHLAHELTLEFPDAQLYVNLHGYESQHRLSPGDALDRFLRALGMPSDALLVDLDEQATRFRAVLADKRALVVLDNASSSDQVRPLLPGSPGCLVVVTSRDPLKGIVAQEGAHLLKLEVLSQHEAVELLAGVAGAHRVRREPEAAADLVRLCGQLPLAVRIAAARLAARPDLRIVDLACRLRQKQNLDALTAEDVSVRASFALSYENLPPSTARMFRYLGLVAGLNFAPGATAAVLNIAPADAEELLEDLVDRHLLTTALGSGRYRLHRLLHWYARERVLAEETEPDRRAAMQRLLTWYLRDRRSPGGSRPEAAARPATGRAIRSNCPHPATICHGRACR
jgi:transcriptional regulator with XRE-family HTH domain